MMKLMKQEWRCGKCECSHPDNTGSRCVLCESNEFAEDLRSQLERTHDYARALEDEIAEISRKMAGLEKALPGALEIMEKLSE